MSSSQHFSVGTIGAGTLARVIAGHAVSAGHHVIFSNSRGRALTRQPRPRAGSCEEDGRGAEPAVQRPSL
jgi:3-hydroxyisobutyrate dehydrogenase-like beta-hydroxyacid dehydrogenase